MCQSGLSGLWSEKDLEERVGLAVAVVLFGNSNFLLPLEVSLLTQRRVKGPFGLHGGHDGKLGKNILYQKGKSNPKILPSLAQLQMKKGDRLIIKTPGGGGYDKPG